MKTKIKPKLEVVERKEAKKLKLKDINELKNESITLQPTVIKPD